MPNKTSARSLVQKTRRKAVLAGPTAEDKSKARESYVPFIRTILILLNETETFPPAVKALLKSDQALALSFLKRYKLSAKDQKTYEKVINDYIKSGGDYYKIEYELADFATVLRDARALIEKDQSVPHEIVTLLKTAIMVAQTGSEPAIARLQKLASLIRDPVINSLYAPVKVEKADKYKQAVRALVKKLTGKPNLELTAEERAAASAKKTAIYKEFLKARAAMLQTGKTKLAHMVRSSGKSMIDAKKASDALDKEGYVHTIPKGFVGLIDDAGKFYTSAGNSIAVPAGGEVQMNPKYDAAKDNGYAFMGRGYGVKDWGRYYTDAFRQRQNALKFEKVANFSGKIDALRAKWGKEIVAGGKGLIPALILEIAYQTQARIGSKGNQTDGENTYGVSTLLGKHVTVKGNSIVFAYTGKSGVKQRHIMTPEDVIAKKAISYLQDFKAETGPNDHIFSLKGGAPVTGNYVNAYLRSLGSPVTIHKLRTFKGSKMVKELLADIPKKLQKGASQKDATDYLKKKVLEVGKALGHMNGDKPTAMTSLRSYVGPDVIQDYYDRIGVRPPPLIEKILNSNTGG